MVFRNVIVDITISSRSRVFSQSRVEVTTSLSNVGGQVVVNSNWSVSILVRISARFKLARVRLYQSLTVMAYLLTDMDGVGVFVV